MPPVRSARPPITSKDRMAGARRSRPPAATVLHAVSFFLVLGLTCAVAAAQEFGQWSWDGSVSAAIRKYADRIEETRQKSTQNDYRLGLGVQGFVLHPAIAAFRVGVDGALSRYARTTSLDTKRIGYRGDLRVLPQGAWPLHVFATRQNYDYGTSSRDDALLLLAVPDRSTTWGGTVRLRSGPLAGLLAGIDHTKIDFATAATQSQTSAGQYADWSRGSAKLQQHYRLDRQSRDFGSYGYTLRDLTLTTDDHGFVRAWRWDLSSAAIRRTIDTATAPAAAFDLGRVQGHLGTAKPERAAWDLAWNSGVSGAGSNKVQTHSMVGRYLRRIDGGFQLAPTVGFGVQRSPSSHVTSPQAGLGVNWNGHRRSFDLAASAVAGYLLLNSSGRDGSSRQSRISTSFGASVGHGNESGFRQQFEVSASRNQLRIAGDSFANTPEL